MSLAGDVAGTALKWGTGHVAFIGCLAAVLGLCGGYMFWHEHVWQQGYDVCQAKVDAVNVQAATDHAETQGQISGAAATQNPKLEAKIDAQGKKIDTLIAEAKKPPQVFHDCAPLPPDQVAGYNSIR